MNKLRRRLTFANVMSVVAVFIAIGGTGYAAFKPPRNSVGTKQLKKNSVTTAKIKKKAVTAAKVKNGTLTGAQINLSTLGTVPTAQQANTLAAPEGWHEVGAPGEPGYQNNWKQATPNSYNAAFFKDHEGIVHLRGIVNGGTGSLIFQLPQGYRPATGKLSAFPAVCSGGGCPAGGIGIVGIFGSGVNPSVDGGVVGPGLTVGLEGITFRAES